MAAAGHRQSGRSRWRWPARATGRGSPSATVRSRRVGGAFRCSCLAPSSRHGAARLLRRRSLGPRRSRAVDEVCCATGGGKRGRENGGWHGRAPARGRRACSARGCWIAPSAGLIGLPIVAVALRKWMSLFHAFHVNHSLPAGRIFYSRNRWGGEGSRFPESSAASPSRRPHETDPQPR